MNEQQKHEVINIFKTVGTIHGFHYLGEKNQKHWFGNSRLKHIQAIPDNKLYIFNQKTASTSADQIFRKWTSQVTTTSNDDNIKKTLSKGGTTKTSSINTHFLSAIKHSAVATTTMCTYPLISSALQTSPVMP